MQPCEILEAIPIFQNSETQSMELGYFHPATPLPKVSTNPVTPTSAPKGTLHAGSPVG